MFDSDARKNSFYFLVFSFLIIIFLLIYMRLSESFPFYFIWDMDHTTSFDMMLIHEGKLPTHINHTGFGMYLVTFFSQKIAYFADIISILKLEDLAESLNPIAVIAEYVSYIRIQSPFISVAIVMLTWVSLVICFRASNIVNLLILIVLGLQSSLWHQSSMIRSELYSMFFYSVGLLMISLTINSKNNNNRKYLTTVLGVFLGLSFITKFQSLFYISITPFLIYLIFLSVEEGKKDLFIHDRRTDRILLYCNLTNLLIVLALFILSYSVGVSSAVTGMMKQMGMRDEYVINSIGIGYLLFSVFLILVSLFLKNQKIKTNILRDFHTLFSLLVMGFTCSFFLHLFIYKNIATSIHYLAYDFTMLFLRKNRLNQLGDLGGYLNTFGSFLQYYSYLFLLTVASISLYIYTFRNRKNTILLIIILFFFLANLFFGTRFFLRDTLWVEILITYLNILLILSIRKAFNFKLSRSLTLVLLVTLSMVGFSKASTIYERTKLNYNIYGFQKKYWMRSVYGNELYPYEQYIKNAISYSAEAPMMAFDAADNFQRNLFDSKFVLYNADVSQRHIGLVGPHFSVSTKDMKHKIKQYPAELKGWLLIDAQNVPLLKKRGLKDNLIARAADHPEKFAPQYTKDELIIIPRSDIYSLLFTSEKNYNFPEQCQVRPYSQQIITTDGKEEKKYSGFLVNSLCKINRKTMKDWFFVFSRKKV